MITKGYLVNEALTELGLASYVFDMQPQDRQSALNKLDDMAGEWSDINMGYLQPTNNGESDQADDSGLTNATKNAVILNLAVRIAPQFGKTPSPETKTAAKQAYNSLPRTIPPMEYPLHRPIGSGNKSSGHF